MCLVYVLVRQSDDMVLFNQSSLLLCLFFTLSLTIVTSTMNSVLNVYYSLEIYESTQHNHQSQRRFQMLNQMCWPTQSYC